MVIAMIAAISRNFVLGKKGGMPWDLPSDLVDFREKTRGKVVIMGKKTWESLPKKPLPDRCNIILSRTMDASTGMEDVFVARTKQEALELAMQLIQQRGLSKEAMVIGGGEIYKLFWEDAARLYLTLVEKDVEDGDAYFPQVEEGDFRLVSSTIGAHKAEDSDHFSLTVWERQETPVACITQGDVAREM